ncbi:MAG: hypothetical protein GY739_19775, partial [Mesoflavibacter sp.]|nr:hypothetical protein [Mesoflavibacter sp.]
YSCTILNLYDAILKAYEIFTQDDMSNVVNSNINNNAQNLVSSKNFMTKNSRQKRSYNKGNLSKKARVRNLFKTQIDEFVKLVKDMDSNPYANWEKTKQEKLHVVGQAILGYALPSELTYLVHRLEAGINTVQSKNMVKGSIRRWIRNKIGTIFPNVASFETTTTTGDNEGPVLPGTVLPRNDAGQSPAKILITGENDNRQILPTGNLVPPESTDELDHSKSSMETNIPLLSNPPESSDNSGILNPPPPDPPTGSEADTAPDPPESSDS